MATEKSAIPQEIYQIKVTLLGTSPSIWRRLLVPAEVTLARLHDVLQAAMGWQDCHMHESRMGRRYFGRPDPGDRLMGMPSVETSARCGSPAYLPGPAQRPYTRMILAIPGSTALSLRSAWLLIRTWRIRCAPPASSPAHLKIVGASGDCL